MRCRYCCVFRDSVNTIALRAAPMRWVCSKARRRPTISAVAFGVVGDRFGPFGEGVKFAHLTRHRRSLLVAGGSSDRLRSVTLCPFIQCFVQRLEIVGDFVFKIRSRLEPGHLPFEPPGHRPQRAGDRERRRRQQLAQHHRHQVTLAARQRMQAGTSQVLRHQIVECSLFRRWRELLQHRDPLGVGDEFPRILPQGALHQWLDPRPQFIEPMLVELTSVAGVERGPLAEEMLVDQARQSPKLHQVVLQGCRGEQELLLPARAPLSRDACLPCTLRRRCASSITTRSHGMRSRSVAFTRRPME